ncbi:MAG: hypothetical protein AAF610_15205 [Pseudomonadota bacterium]
MRWTRSRLVGVGAAVIALAIAFAVTSPDDNNRAPPAGTSNDQSTAVELRNKPDPFGAEVPASTAIQPTAAEATLAQGAGTASAPTAEEDWDAPCTCWDNWLVERIAIIEATRESESVDISWAYETEQLLTQYFKDRQDADELEITSIECKSTYCTINANVAAAAVSEANQMIRQALSEPWSTFKRNTQTRSSDAVKGRIAFSTLIERKTLPDDYPRTALPAPPTAEACPCSTPQWRARKEAHERALRAAEPKDPDWAYAVEQQLHQLISEHPRAVELQVTTVDCRTTFCEIKATALLMPALDAFNKVIDRASLSQRFDLSAERQTTTETDGTLQIMARLRRR